LQIFAIPTEKLKNMSVDDFDKRKPTEKPL